MTKEIDKASERVRQNRAARATGAPADESLRAVRVASQAAAFRAGDRVLDVATGIMGTVTGAGLTDKLLRGDVRVLLDDGRDVLRGAFGLLYRPTGA
jgi:hypothetical protein